jgi:hypothetical protein
MEALHRYSRPLRPVPPRRVESGFTGQFTRHEPKIELAPTAPTKTARKTDAKTMQTTVAVAAWKRPARLSTAIAPAERMTASHAVRSRVSRMAGTMKRMPSSAITRGLPTRVAAQPSNVPTPRAIVIPGSKGAR